MNAGSPCTIAQSDLITFIKPSRENRIPPPS
jgi:hypothetical protein